MRVAEVPRLSKPSQCIEKVIEKVIVWPKQRSPLSQVADVVNLRLFDFTAAKWPFLDQARLITVIWLACSKRT